MDNLVKVHTLEVTPVFPLFVFKVDNSFIGKQLFTSVNGGELKEAVPSTWKTLFGHLVLEVEVTPEVNNEIVVWEKSKEIINETQTK